MANLTSMIGKKCIVRTYSAGVWFGEVAEKEGAEVILKDACRIWCEKASQIGRLALYGLDPREDRVSVSAETVWLEAIELIPASDVAISSIEGAPYAEAK